MVENASDLSTFIARRIISVERTIEPAASSDRYSDGLSRVAEDFGTDINSPVVGVFPSTQTELEGQLDCRNRDYGPSERSVPATQAHVGIMTE